MLSAALKMCIQTCTVCTKKGAGVSGSWRRVYQHPCSRVECVIQTAGVVHCGRGDQDGSQSKEVMQTGRRRWLEEMPGVVSLQLAPCTLSGAVGRHFFPVGSFIPVPQELSHPHGNPVPSFPASAVLRQAGHTLGGQRHNQNIPIWEQLTWASSLWFPLPVSSLLCCSSFT